MCVVAEIGTSLSDRSQKSSSPRVSGCQWIAYYTCDFALLACVTDQGPRILLDFLCTSGGVSQLVLTSSGFTWISRVARCPRHVGAESFWLAFLGGLVHRHRAGVAMSTGTWSPIIRCTY